MTIEQLLAVIGTLLMCIGGYIGWCLRELTVSVQKLTVNMSVLIAEHSYLEKRVTRLEQNG